MTTITPSHPSQGRRIILVEDDQDLRKNILKYLTLAGFSVTGVGSAREFYNAISVQPFSLAIIDIGLPDQSGFVLSEYVRNNTDLRIVILTARSSLDDRLSGLESGADVYLVKPVDGRELTATIVNIFSRMDSGSLPGRADVPPPAAAMPPWKLDRQAWALFTPAGQEIRLTSKEYEFILALLDSERKLVVPRQEIFEKLDYPFTPQSSHALEVMVSRLRKKVESHGHGFPVKTSHGTGYVLSADMVAS